MYLAIINSNSSHQHTHRTISKGALKAALDFGRCEGGEVVRVYSKTGRLLSEDRWTPYDGGKYYRFAV